MTGSPVGQAGGTSTLLGEPVGQQHGPGSLLRAEAHRFLSRRFIRLLVALAAVGMLGGVVLASTQFAMTTPQELARATENRAAAVAEQAGYRESCVRESTPTTAEQRCGPAPTEADFGGLEQFLDRPPFTLQEHGLAAIVGVAALSAALTFVIGATSIGAEWSTRSVVALLFWEPRRLRVVASKLAVLVGATAALGVLAHAGWLAAAWLLARTRGSTAAPDGLWSDMLAASGRGVLLAVLGGLFGFGAANLLRSTAACLGVAFVYVAVIESLVRGLSPARQRWLLADNAIALVQRGGHRIYVDEGFVDEFGAYQYTGLEVLLSNLHGAAVLSAVAAVLLALGTLLFVRRDLH